eukprot:gene7938-13828_t
MGGPKKLECRTMININETTLLRWNGLRKEASTNEKLLLHNEFGLYLLNLAANHLLHRQTAETIKSSPGHIDLLHEGIITFQPMQCRFKSIIIKSHTAKFNVDVYINNSTLQEEETVEAPTSISLFKSPSACSTGLKNLPVAESTPRFPKRARTLEFPVTMTSEQTTEGDFGSDTKQFTHSNEEEESSKSILGSTLAESFHATRMSKMNESFNSLEGILYPHTDSQSTSSDESSSYPDDSSSLLTSDSDLEFWSDDEFLENPGNQIDEIHDKERDLNRTFLEEQEMELCTTFNMDNTIFAPFNSNVKEINSKLESMLQAMFKEDMVVSDIVNRDRIIVTVEKLIELKCNMYAWTELKQNTSSILTLYKDLCPIGDGRNDSPGFSARYCVYVLMEQLTGIIIDLEVLDRRKTGGHSPNMEREGLTRLLERLMKTFSLSEVVTDASSSIIKRLSDLKGNITFGRFRHTGNVENCNSMLKKYAPKRVAFEYIYFIARIALAAMDHNLHLFRPLAVSRAGKKLFKKKYNRRTKTYHAEPVKTAKQYEYMTCLLSRVLKARKERTATVLQRNTIRQDDPKRIALIFDPNVQPPPLELLIQDRVSRLKQI